MEELTTDLDGRTWWWWCSWRLFERMSGMAPSEADAAKAVEHFLDTPTSYSLTERGAGVSAGARL